MVTLRKGFAIAAVALSAWATSAQPAFSAKAKPPIETTTDAGEDEEEEVFHRIEELETKRDKLPKAILALRWQQAFVGDDKTAPRPQYIATLFAQYKKLSRPNQSLTIQWVETLADEVVQRGDAKMFLELARHYVKSNTPATGIYSLFLGEANTFNMDISRLGNLLKTSLAKQPVYYQKQFKKDLGTAAAEQLVTNGEPRNGFVTATLGYELINEYAYSDEALEAFDAVVKTAIFQKQDLHGFLTKQGIQDFMTVTAVFMQKMTWGHSPLTHLFNMGLRVDEEAGESMRNGFIRAIATNKPEETLFAINYTYKLAAQQRYAGKDNTMAQQMLSPVWEDAVSDIMTPEIIKKIYMNYYTGTNIEAPKAFTIARKKQFSGAEETEMQAVYADLLKATVKNPRGYYNMINDLSHDETFRKALADQNTALVSQNILPHFSYLASIYMEDAAAGSTIDSNIRMMHLMRLDATLPPAQQVTMQGFQRVVLQLAKAARNSGEQSYQLVKLLASANNTGWAKHITMPFVQELRKQIVVLKGSFAEETLDSIFRVQADERARIKQWQTHINHNSK